MRFKEFLITRYGPLVELGRFVLRDFNLFFGKNEEGKTLLLDSIVKFLFKKEYKVFDKIDRVDETPEGYLIMETGRGETIKFPGKVDLEEKTGLSPREYRNIFIIRSSDLFIDKEDVFYRNVQNRLTGLRTDEIEGIKSQLLEMGRLAPKGDFRNIKEEKLKARLLDAQKLTKRIDALKERIKEEEFEGLEKELFKMKEGIKGIEKKLNDYEDARRRETYEKSLLALNELDKNNRELKQLNCFIETNNAFWRDAERNIENAQNEKNALILQLAEKERVWEKRKEEIVKKERNFLIYMDRKGKVEKEIEPELRYYERLSQEIAKGKGILKALTILDAVFGLFCAVSIIGYIFQQSFPLGFSIILFGIIFVALLSILMVFSRKKAGMAGTFEKIRLMTVKLGLSGKNINDIIFNINGLQEEYKKMGKEIQDIKDDIRFLENEVRRIKEDIPEIEEKVRKSEKGIEEIKRKTGVETRKEYNQNLERKNQKEKERERDMGILKSLLEVKGETEDEKIDYWREKVEEYNEYKDKATALKYDEKTVSGLKKKKGSLIEEEKVLRKKMKTFTDELGEIESAINHTVLMTTKDNYLNCETLVDLDEVEERLKSFVDENERMRETVLNAKVIFEEIEKEEEEKVSSLFGKDSNVSTYFRKITEGMYEKVEYDAENGSIEVFPKKGQPLGADKLSSGAFDQLYLSIRLALGEKILKGEKGFFIMDDPFVKSDMERLKRQINILKELAHSGWQIIYFSAKDEVKECLEEEIKNGEISSFEI